MAVIDLRWRQAVEEICRELQEFAVLRADGLQPAEIAAVMHIEPATAARYEATINRLIADVKHEGAQW